MASAGFTKHGSHLESREVWRLAGALGAKDVPAEVSWAVAAVMVCRRSVRWSLLQALSDRFQAPNGVRCALQGRP